MTSLTGRWSRTLQRAATVSFMSTLAVGVAAGPALATTGELPLHDDHRGATAAEFETHECDDKLPQKTGQDGWHFVIPGNHTRFVSLTLTYELVGGVPHEVVLDQPEDFGPPSAKHAYVYTPAGATLVDGTAEVEGEPRPDFFNLSHTCPAGLESPSPSPSVSESSSEGPNETTPPDVLPTTSASESPSAPASHTPSESSSAPAPGNGGGLPVTGLALTGVIVTGLGLVGAGVAMRAIRRRGDDEESGEESTDI